MPTRILPSILSADFANIQRDIEASRGFQPVAVADHCWGCTAGAGSSCGGALA